MKIIIFGLTVSSSWGNGHATLWRGLCRALCRNGHEVVFFEKDVPYYAENRDLFLLPPGGDLRLYSRLEEIAPAATRELDSADVAISTSYCPDGARTCELVLSSRVAIKVFYDLDTPVTLDQVRRGEQVGYLPSRGLRDFDLVLSYTGGRALKELVTLLGAKRVAPLYGSVDPEAHFPVSAVAEFRGDLSYLGTYSEDRQAALETLLIDPARQLPARRFVIGGAQYPQAFPWTANIFFVRHLPPLLHPSFFCSSRLTLNITRRAMVEYGYCPSGRLFEAAACGVPVLSDNWEGIDEFLTPGTEVLIVNSAADVLNVMDLTDAELGRISSAARERVLEQHSAQRRVRELELICGSQSRETAMA